MYLPKKTLISLSLVASINGRSFVSNNRHGGFFRPSLTAKRNEIENIQLFTKRSGRVLYIRGGSDESDEDSSDDYPVEDLDAEPTIETTISVQRTARLETTMIENEADASPSQPPFYTEEVETAEETAEEVEVETEEVAIDVGNVDEVEPEVVVEEAVVAPVAPVAPVAAVEESAPVASVPEAPRNPKLANALERTGPAVAMLIALYGILTYTGENGFYVLVSLLQLGMYTETTGIIEAFHGTNGKDAGVKLEKWWWFATIFTSTTLRTILPEMLGINQASMNLVCFGMVSVGLVVAVYGMATHSSAGDSVFRKYLGEVAAFNFALVFLVGQSSFWIKTVQSFGLGWIIFPALLVIVNDTMAYVFGVLMGKHKLLPRLSPKKTVEGFIGAGISTIAIAIPLLNFFVKKCGDKFTSVMGMNNGNVTKHAIAFALYTSLIAPFGGFLASAVKRAHGAKDFGTLIPGHGGVVDRMDCQIVTAPFVYLYLKSCLGSSGELLASAAAPLMEEVVEAAVEIVTSGIPTI
uniref:Phosphatidate cytidylyltransferase n=1 Tax=Chaetoceros debilis TaxID=122233 RepID=A0A7S3QEP5_9STRA